MKAAHRVIKNTGILYTRMALSVVISLYTTRVLLAALGSTDYGLFNVVGSSIAMLGFLHASMTAATRRFMSHAQGSGDSGKMTRIFNVSIVIHLLIAIGVFLALQVAGFFFFKKILHIPAERLTAVKMVYQCVIISTVFSVISVPYDSVITAHENMLLFSIISLLEVLLKLAIAIYISKSGFDHLKAYAILTVSLSVFLLLIQRVYCHWKYSECSIQPFKYFDKGLFKSMMGFGGWSFILSFVQMSGNYGAGVLINMFFMPAVNAAQGIANQINGQIGAFSSVMMTALSPMITKSEGAGNRQLMLKASMAGSKMAFSLFAFLAIPVFFEVHFILNIWIKKYPDFTLIFCRLLMIKTLFELPFLAIETSLSAEGNIRKPILAKSTILLLPLPISYVLYKHGFPPDTIYFIVIVASLLKDSVNVYFAKINLGLSVSSFLKNILLKCLAIVIIVGLITCIPHYYLPEGFTRLFAVLITGFISFAICFYTFLLNIEEKELISKAAMFVISRLKNLVSYTPAVK